MENVILKGLEDFPYKLCVMPDPFHNGVNYSINYRDGIMLWLNVIEEYKIYTVVFGFYPVVYNIEGNFLRKLTSTLKKLSLSLEKTFTRDRNGFTWNEYRLILKEVKDIYKIIETIDSYLLVAEMSKGG